MRTTASVIRPNCSGLGGQMDNIEHTCTSNRELFFLLSRIESFSFRIIVEQQGVWVNIKTHLKTLAEPIAVPSVLVQNNLV